MIYSVTSKYYPQKLHFWEEKIQFMNFAGQKRLWILLFYIGSIRHARVMCNFAARWYGTRAESAISRRDGDGSSSIDGQVFIFPAGNYDPTTFKYSTLGSIETSSRQKVSFRGGRGTSNKRCGTLLCEAVSSAMAELYGIISMEQTT